MTPGQKGTASARQDQSAGELENGHAAVLRYAKSLPLVPLRQCFPVFPCLLLLMWDWPPAPCQGREGDSEGFYTGRRTCATHRARTRRPAASPTASATSNTSPIVQLMEGSQTGTPLHPGSSMSFAAGRDT